MYGLNSAREQQVAGLLNAHPQATPRNSEKSVLDFGLDVRRGQRTDRLVIRVSLPPAFPNAAPMVAVTTPGARHPWLDNSGRVVGAPALNSWNAYSRLDAAVGEVLSHFVAHPPTIGFGPSQPPYPGATGNRSSAPYQSSSRGSGSGAREKKEEDDDGVFLPPVPDEFPELAEIDSDQLTKLRDDPGEFKSYFESLPMPTMAFEMREQITESNKKQAKLNLSFKERIEDLQNATIKLQEEAAEHWKRFKELEARQDVAMGQYDPLRLLTKLEASCTKLDDESELLASEFMNGDVPLNEFLTRELELRKLYHLRKAKAERFRFQLKSSS